MRRLIMLLPLVCLPAIAQYDLYTVSHAATLSAAGTALAIQLPLTGSHITEVLEATAQTSAACGVRLERNAAVINSGNATAATIVSLNPETTPAALDSGQSGAPNLTAWTGANIPTGTATGPSWTIPAGAILPFGGGRVMTTKASVVSNYILRVVSPCSASVSLHFTIRVRR